MDGKKTKKKRTLVDYFLTLVLVAAIGVFCYAGYHLITILGEYKKGTDEYKKLAEAAVTMRGEEDKIEVLEAEEIKTEDVSIEDTKTEEVLEVLNILEEIVLEEVEGEIEENLQKESIYRPVSKVEFNEIKEVVHEEKEGAVKYEESSVNETAGKEIEEAVKYEELPMNETAGKETEEAVKYEELPMNETAGKETEEAVKYEESSVNEEVENEIEDEVDKKQKHCLEENKDYEKEIMNSIIHISGVFVENMINIFSKLETSLKLHISEYAQKAPVEVEFHTLKEINNDVVGWIYMEGIDSISYPIVQGEDNEKYLYHTYEGMYNLAGAIFMDYENNCEFNDCNTFIYGHNMKNGSMFAKLKKYAEDEEIYNKNKYFWILTPEADYKYEIVAAYTTGVRSDTYTLFNKPGEKYLEYLKKIREWSAIKTTSRVLTAQAKVVTLSTCTGNDATRFVVQGVRVNRIPK